jgi:hypothetical protein
MSTRLLRTIKIPDQVAGSRINREAALAHFRELHKKRTGRDSPAISIEKRDGYLEVSVKQV